MKINLTTQEMCELLTSGKVSEEVKRTIAGAIIEVIMSDAATQSVIAMVKSKAEESVDAAIKEALYVKAGRYSAPAELQGYLAAELTARLKKESGLTAQSIMAAAAEKIAEEQLRYLVEREVDREVARSIDSIVKGQINKVFIDKISDEYLESAVNRVMRKQFEK